MERLADTLKQGNGIDSLTNYVGDIPDKCWLIVLSQNRDSDTLIRSNWETALQDLGGESKNVQIFRFGHWGCGWYEVLCVRENTDKATIGENIQNSLEDYPALDENHYYDMETTEAIDVWENCYTTKERIEYIRNNQDNFSCYDFSELRKNVNGELFSGYASELLY